MSIDFGSDIYEEPIVAKTFLQEDAQEGSLRPKSLWEYIGQEKAKENLSIFIEAAQKREESLDHVLLHGPPGLGKTTLAGIIAQEMGVNIRITSGPAIEKPGDLAALLTNLNEGDILFVDEIHRLNRSVEEILYPAMEDYVLDIIQSIGMEDRLKALPSTLSGGQKQRTAIARALASRPAIILADEPTGNLDSHTEMEVVAMLKSCVAKYGQTLVMITHDETIAQMADRTLIIEDGKVVG